MAETLKYCVNGEWRESTTDKYMDVTDSSTGEVFAKAPCCTRAEVEGAIDAAAKAYPAWSGLPMQKRTQVLYKWKALVEAHADELAYICSREVGKNLDEACGEIVKIVEGCEVGVAAPMIAKGESLMNVSTGHDTVTYREPLGVFAGIAPFNFPAMIPWGWMIPLAIVTGNTFVLKAASLVPTSSISCSICSSRPAFPTASSTWSLARATRPRLLMTDPAGTWRQLRGFDQRRQACLFHRCRSRQTRPGSDRGQEPRSRSRGCLARARRRRHHQLHLRLRWHALHGPAGVRGTEERGRRVHRLHEEVRRAACGRVLVRSQDRTGTGRQRRPSEPSSRTGSTRVSKKAPTWFSTAATSSFPASRRASSSARRSSIT